MENHVHIALTRLQMRFPCFIHSRALTGKLMTDGLVLLLSKTINLLLSSITQVILTGHKVKPISAGVAR